MKHAGVHSIVRRTHEERVLGVLREHGVLSRGEIADLVGLSRTTISEITGNLLAHGAIVVVDTDAASREGSGRPAERLALDPASGQYMGIDFGHRRVQIAVADASHDIIAADSEAYGDPSTWDERLSSAFALIDRITVGSGMHLSALQGIGIGVLGPYPTMPLVRPQEGWGRTESARGIDAVFADRFGARVIVDNNTRFAALAEAISESGATVQDLLYVRLSDGVGGGLVVGGRLVTGSAGLAGEFGHITAVPGGRRCRCGKQGCVETVASVPAILAEIRARGVDVETLDDLSREVARSQPVVDEVLREAGAAVGRALGAAAMAVNPASIVIGGEITGIAPAIVEHIASTLRYELSCVAEAMPTVKATNGKASERPDFAGAVGAIAALFRQTPILAAYPAATGAIQQPTTTRSSIR
jgi:predicted NBD/HSP70 family sugar kinase